MSWKIVDNQPNKKYEIVDISHQRETLWSFEKKRWISSSARCYIAPLTVLSFITISVYVGFLGSLTSHLIDFLPLLCCYSKPHKRSFLWFIVVWVQTTSLLSLEWSLNLLLLTQISLGDRIWKESILQVRLSLSSFGGIGMMISFWFTYLNLCLISLSACEIQSTQILLFLLHRISFLMLTFRWLKFDNYRIFNSARLC